MNSHHRRLFIRKWARMLHIFLSMFGLLMLMFFASTGLMLNQEEWFGYAEPRVAMREGTIPNDLLINPDKLAVVELLRKDFMATGAMKSFEADPDELNIVFKSLGRRTQAVITRADGHTEVTIENHGFIGRVVELHRGVDAGNAWRRIIDISAVVFLIIGLSGLSLWFFVPKWRPLGLAAVAICLSVAAAVYFTVVP